MQAPSTPLETRFERLLSLLGCSQSCCPKWWKVISDSYGEQHRHYHTLAHLENMFGLLDEVGVDEACYRVLALAIFFHDIVYDAKRKDNELRSVEVFKQFAAEVSLDEQVVGRVCRLIEATISHAIPPTHEHDDELRLFLDLDLLILGMPPQVYERYAAQIRQEYIHFPDLQYRSGRAAVLNKFLERDTLFFQESMREKLEARARDNVSREIQALGAPNS